VFFYVKSFYKKINTNNYKKGEQKMSTVICGICEEPGADMKVDPIDKLTMDIDTDKVHEDCYMCLLACQNACMQEQ
jgi:hypothetical protein